MSENLPWTVGRLLNWTADYLNKRGADSPRLDAETLLAEAMRCPRINLYAAFETEPSEDVRAKFRDWVKRRAEGEPTAYLVGHREFYSLDFRVTSDVLIPRPETELLVVESLDRAKELPSRDHLQVADVGTGSGVVAVCLAKYLPTASVTAIDRSAPALAVAKENAAKHGFAERIEFVESDLFSAIPAEATYDLIASNPPYVAEGDEIDDSVVRYEPHSALFAGPKGTEVIERLVPQAAERLRSGGFLLLEISPMIHDAVSDIIRLRTDLELLPTAKDFARHPRVVQARKL